MSKNVIKGVYCAAALAVSAFVGYKVFMFLKPEKIEKVEDIDESEIDPYIDLDD